MKIKICATTLDQTTVLYMNDKKRDNILLNTKETNFSAKEFKFRVCDMVSDWPNELTDKSLDDGLTYTIVIKTDEKEVSYLFENKFPEDIYRLYDLINDVVGEVKNV